MLLSFSLLLTLKLYLVLLIKKRVHSLQKKLVKIKEIKQYGTKAGIEGPTLEGGTLVTVLEDVVTTAGSGIKALKKLRENNYVVEEVLSIVDRQEGGLEALEDENVKLKSLFTIKDFL